MIVYVESNFVLELALAQEQAASCDELVRLCEQGKLILAIPAYSLAEPYETLIRRQRHRAEMLSELDREIRQITRSAGYRERQEEFQKLVALLADSADEEAKSLESVRSRLLATCHVISLSTTTLSAAAARRAQHGLSPQDALVYTSVLSHLTSSQESTSCFLNRNSRDFDDPDIVEELKRHGCSLVFSFDHGLKLVREQTKDA